MKPTNIELRTKKDDIVDIDENGVVWWREGVDPKAIIDAGLALDHTIIVLALWYATNGKNQDKSTT